MNVFITLLAFINNIHPMSLKKVSIVLCTYNGADYITKQLDSIINQTYPISEIIIQDDCSTDNTISILEEYEKKYDYIHLYKNEKQKGVNENFFSAMLRANSEYIAISDQDDIWELDKIENQFNTIGEKWLSFGFSNFFSNNNDSTYYDKRIPNTKAERMIYISGAGGHTFLLKKEMLSYIPHSIPIIYDQVIMIVAASNNMISFVDKVLVNHREHTMSVTYTPPAMKRGGNSKSLSNIIKSAIRTFVLYVELKNTIRNRFVDIYKLLNHLPNWEAKDMALKIAKSQSEKGIWAYFKLTYYCIHSRRYLFYSEEKNNLLTFLRALYFPISCSDYFRYLSKSYNKFQKKTS